MRLECAAGPSPCDGDFGGCANSIPIESPEANPTGKLGPRTAPRLQGLIVSSPNHGPCVLRHRFNIICWHTEYAELATNAVAIPSTFDNPHRIPDTYETQSARRIGHVAHAGSASARGPSAAATGPFPGDRRTTTPPSQPSTAPSTSASTGSTPPPSTASATPRRSSARAVKSSSVKPFIFTKCGMVWNQQREIKRTLLRDPPRGRRQPAPPAGRRHRPLPDPLAHRGPGHRGRLDHHGRAAARGQGPLHRRLQLLRRPDAALPGHRADHLPPAALLALNRAAEAEILPFCRDNHIGVINYSPMSSGLLTGAMTKERVANLPARRLPPQGEELPGAAAQPQPCAGRLPASRSARATASPPASSPSRGRCAIPPSPPPSSAGAARSRSTGSGRPPTSASPRARCRRSRPSSTDPVDRRTAPHHPMLPVDPSGWRAAPFLTGYLCVKMQLMCHRDP